MRRVVLRGRHYPRYAPSVLWQRLTHRLAGPLLGCSCSGPGAGGKPSLLAAPDGSCLHSPWRLSYPARDGYKDRVRIDKLERQVQALAKQTEAVYTAGFNAGVRTAKGTGAPGEHTGS